MCICIYIYVGTHVARTASTTARTTNQRRLSAFSLTRFCVFISQYYCSYLCFTCHANNNKLHATTNTKYICMYIYIHIYVYSKFQNVLPPFVLCSVATPPCYANCCSHSLALYLNTAVCIHTYINVCMCVCTFFHNRNFLLLLLLRAFSRTQERLFCAQLLGLLLLCCLTLLLLCYHCICFVLRILNAVSVSYILRCTRTHRRARTHRYSDEWLRKSDDWKAASAASASPSPSTAATSTQRSAAVLFYFIHFFVFLVCQFVFVFLACRRVSLFSVNSICTLCIKYPQNHFNINWK